MVKEEYGHNAGSIANPDGLEPEQSRKIFIGGLANVTDEESLRSYYGKWGEIVDCVVMRDPQTKRSRGFGFVSYTSMAEVNVAMENRPHEIDGKRVDPKRAIPREDSSRGQKLPSTNRLYVSGIREGHTEEMLREYFGQYGSIEKVEVMIDKATGKPRGFAFVSFDDYDPVDRCVLIKSHTINGYRCDVKKGVSKEEMAKQGQGSRDRVARVDRAWGPGGGRGGGPAGWGGGDRGRGGWGAGNGGGGWGASASGWNSQGYGDGGYGGGSWGATPARGAAAYEPSPWANPPQTGNYGGGSQSGGYGNAPGGYNAQGGSSGGYSGYAPAQPNYGSGTAGGGWGQAAQQDPWRR